ncbi:glutaminase [Pilimelia terevasa]|uniref:Glutaminase n=2 Tax=Pilimelia terevasa TaxID=53372 RepID=A0A8J3FLN2_9ACTN|nr:glutaminase [Pilimelia terevasa]
MMASTRNRTATAAPSTTPAAADAPDRSGPYRRIYESFPRRLDGTVTRGAVLGQLRRVGISADDPRLRGSTLTVGDSDEPLTLDQFVALCGSDGGLISRAAAGELVIPDFTTFAGELTGIYQAAREDRSGRVADYIPQLARVEPDQFAVAVCTVDGQQLALGDSDATFCVQSISKAINYCLALEEHGPDGVHKHVGREPSGQGFNELTFNRDGLPHNPLINAGGIMSGALIRPDLNVADRFDFVADAWRRLAGGGRVGFNNAVYLSERATADRNFALGYSMRENRAFPPTTDLVETLEFYFQCCSIEVNARALGMVAGTLANGGRCPVTGEQVLATSTVQRCLSLMSSCGMYDYSGEFAFSIGLPAKSGVSGAVMVVVPQVMGVCVWSPRLDPIGNSVRGVRFCEQLVARYNFHTYDGLVTGGRGSKRDPRLRKHEAEINGVIRLCWAASEGDLEEVRAIIASGVDPDAADYDGRTALHLAASEGHPDVVAHLLSLVRQPTSVDRWGGTPADDARRGGHAEVLALLAAGDAPLPTPAAAASTVPTTRKERSNAH